MPYVIKKDGKYLENMEGIRLWTERIAWAEIMDDDQDEEARTLAAGYDAQLIEIEMKEVEGDRIMELPNHIIKEIIDLLDYINGNWIDDPVYREIAGKALYIGHWPDFLNFEFTEEVE